MQCTHSIALYKCKLLLNLYQFILTSVIYISLLSRVEGFIGEDVDAVVSTSKHLPSDAVCWGIRLPGDVCMTQSSVVISHVTKQSSFLIAADQQDLGKRIGVGLQTARNAVKSTSGSQVMVQVTAGQCTTHWSTSFCDGISGKAYFISS